MNMNIRSENNAAAAATNNNNTNKILLKIESMASRKERLVNSSRKFLFFPIISENIDKKLFAMQL